MSLFFLFFFLSLNILPLQATSQPTHPDLAPLLTFKSHLSDPLHSLTTWSATSLTPCNFTGITCSPTTTRVTKLILESLSLSFTSPPTSSTPLSLLSPLTSLKVLSLKHNSLSSPLSPFPTLPSLKLLFLSHNSFSSPLPPSLSLPSLYRLDFSHNSLTGSIPPSLFLSLPRLLTLRLENNSLNGSLSPLSPLSSLQDFNISSNHFSGQIPPSLSIFSASSFSLNSNLCGPPLLVSCSDPVRPGNGAISTPAPQVISSTPDNLKTPHPENYNSDHHNKRKNKMGFLAILVIILADIVVLGVISILLYCYFCRGKDNKKGLLKSKKETAVSRGERIVYSSSITMSPYNNVGGGTSGEGKMVFFSGERRFELEDLLKASAEMLGKGTLGTAYKAVLDDGTVVAVKRLKEMQVGGNGGNVNGKKEFDGLMEVLGRLRHPNLVGLKAYYFARDEKLMVFDYLVNGSLFWLLHGNRGPGRTPLDWTTRLKVAAGAARGIAFIHNSCRALKLIHGNIKSTNVLIDKAGSACVSDFGFSSFAPASASNPRSNGYRAPESLDGRKLTQKADVYSFGVLLLEILTGKCPSVVEGSGPYATVGVGGVVDLPRWVQSVVREEWTAEVFDLELMRYKDIEEEMVGLLQIAMACTNAAPDQRPRMSQVVKMIEELRGVEVSPSHEAFDSDSPSVSEDTGGVIQ